MIDDNPLGTYLKSRRRRLDPVALGFGAGRRRTSGLRREEVAQRAQVSPAWYTWLEQGRGGRPSMEALERIAGALELTPTEREHLFVLAHQRPLEPPETAQEGVSPRLQRMLDSLETSPAYIKTTATVLVAWNRAAEIVMDECTWSISQGSNILRYLFCDPHARCTMLDWEHDARFAVAAFRYHAARSGPHDRIAEIAEQLQEESEDFRRIWADNDVGTYGEGTRHILHPVAGPLAFEYSTFRVDGQPNLTLVIYMPATPADFSRVCDLLA